MNKYFSFLLFFLLIGFNCVQAENNSLELRLKKNQQIEQLNTVGFDLYFDVSEDYTTKVRQQFIMNPTAENGMLFQVLNGLSINKPAFSGSLQTRTLSTVIDTNHNNSTVQQKSKCQKCSLQENLINNFTLTYHADKPEKNFTNLPIPFEFNKFGRENSSTIQVATDGTLLNVENIEQLIAERFAEEGLPDELKAQILSVLGAFYQSIPEMKIPTYLTGIHLPSTTRQVGDSWTQKVLTVPSEFVSKMSEKDQQLLSLTDEKITLLHREKGSATFYVELPVVQKQEFTTPDDALKISFNGVLLSGDIKIDEATGLLTEAELISDFTITISKIEGHPSPALAEMPNQVTFRFNGTVGTETKIGA